MIQPLRRRSVRLLASALALVGAAVVTAPALAKEWRTLTPSATLGPLVVSSPEAEAVDALARDAATLGIDGIDLAPRDTIGAGSTLTVLFDQRWNGLRVLDRGGAVRFEDGSPRHVQLDVARGLAVSAVPSLDADAAATKLSSKLGHAVVPLRSELAVLGRDAGILVWVLDVREDGTRYVVDANTGKLVLRIPVMLDALGRVYLVNQVETPMPVDVTLNSLATGAMPLKLDGWNGLLRVANYVNGSAESGYTLEQTLGPSTGTDFLYNPPGNPFDPKDGFAQVNLFYHLTDIRDFFTALGLDQTSNKWKLTAVANAMEDGSPLDNAFFSPFGQDGPFSAPNLIGIGQGSTIDFAYDSDVFKHEFGHYIAGNTSNFNLGPFFTNEYGLQPLSGALDEGLADYWACTDNDSAVLGEAALAPFGAARDLGDTHKVCPDDVGVESHADGELVGSVSWSLRLALGQSRADKLVWGAETMLPPGATFGDFYQGLITTMKGMQGSGELNDMDVAAINDVLAQRGLDDCGPILAIDGGETRTTTIQGLELASYYLQTDCFELADAGIQFQSPFHFSRVTSASDQAVRFSLELNPDWPDEMRGTVYIQHGGPVVYGTDEFGLPAPAQYEYAFPIGDDFSLDVVLDATSNPPFIPGETYFVSVSSSTCPNVRMSISASNQPNTSTVSNSVASSNAASSGSGSSAGGEGGGGDKRIVYIDRGCGCVVASDTTNLGSALAGLALGAAALVRRRHRRR